MTIDEWLQTPTLEIPSQADVELLEINLVRDCVRLQNEADENARAKFKIHYYDL